MYVFIDLLPVDSGHQIMEQTRYLWPFDAAIICGTQIGYIHVHCRQTTT
jgi:hypothetical protein